MTTDEAKAIKELIKTAAGLLQLTRALYGLFQYTPMADGVEYCNTGGGIYMREQIGKAAVAFGLAQQIKVEVTP